MENPKRRLPPPPRRGRLSESGRNEGRNGRPAQSRSVAIRISQRPAFYAVRFRAPRLFVPHRTRAAWRPRSHASTLARLRLARSIEAACGRACAVRSLAPFWSVRGGSHPSDLHGSAPVGPIQHTFQRSSIRDERLRTLRRTKEQRAPHRPTEGPVPLTTGLNALAKGHLTIKKA